MDLTALILITIPAMLFGAYLKDVIDNNGGDNKKLYKKKCPECGEYTYSASREIWECATCGEKLDEIKAIGAGKEAKGEQN